MLNFDNLAANTAITNQYQSQGVLFHSNLGSPAHIWSDPAEATSPPNIMVGTDNFADLFVRFVDPTSAAPTTARQVSVVAISVGHAQWTVTARDSNGQPLQTFVLQNLGGPANGFGNQDTVTFTSSAIASIDFVFTISNPADGIGIDDLSFRLNPTCQPASWINYGTGHAGTNGVPSITSSGNPALATTPSVQIGSSANSSTLGGLVIGFSRANTPTAFGGNALVTVATSVILSVPPGGTTYPISIPNHPTFCGLRIDLQSALFDAGASHGIAFSPGLEYLIGI
ncbi:MAG: hypothetical protein KDC98_00020 [Planctomycetes bacterium]|nr:hypothetical protein [Planctomycetota bacterium]